MCGRYALTQEHHNIMLDDFGSSAPEFAVPSRYNIAPTAPVMVIRVKGSDQDQAMVSDDRAVEKEACLMRWGLVPGWAKELRADSPLFNARSETILHKPAFRSPFRRRKCLVPASGYYEWQKSSLGGKIPHYIQLKDRSAFVFAGIWEIWMGPAGEDWLETVTILTKKSTGYLSHIHSRSPVIIHPSDYDLWLRAQDPPDRDIFKKLNKDLDHDLMSHQVSSFVSNARNDGAVCIEPTSETVMTKKEKTNQFSLF